MGKKYKRAPKLTKEQRAEIRERAVAEARKLPAHRPTEYRPEFCQGLIQHMKQGLSFQSFAGTVGTTFRTLYRWAEEHEEFRHARDEGRSHLLAFHEQVARNIGMGIIPAPPPGAKSTRGDAKMQMFLLSVHGAEAGYDKLFNRSDTPVERNVSPQTEVKFVYVDENGGGNGGKSEPEVIAPGDAGDVREVQNGDQENQGGGQGG